MTFDCCLWGSINIVLKDIGKNYQTLVKFKFRFYKDTQNRKFNFYGSWQVLKSKQSMFKFDESESPRTIFGVLLCLYPH